MLFNKSVFEIYVIHPKFIDNVLSILPEERKILKYSDGLIFASHFEISCMILVNNVVFSLTFHSPGNVSLLHIWICIYLFYSGTFHLVGFLSLALNQAIYSFWNANVKLFIAVENQWQLNLVCGKYIGFFFLFKVHSLTGF